MRKKKDIVSGKGYTFFSLRQPMEFLGHCRHPKFFEIHIIHELGVLHDGLFGHRVDNTIANFFDVNYVMNGTRRLAEGLLDCIGRGGC
jgi:hypothetical protein